MKKRQGEKDMSGQRQNWPFKERYRIKMPASINRCFPLPRGYDIIQTVVLCKMNFLPWEALSYDALCRRQLYRVFDVIGSGIAASAPLKCGLTSGVFLLCVAAEWASVRDNPGKYR